MYGMGVYEFGDIVPTICGFDGFRDSIMRSTNS
jgi:hypothetical protein